MLVDRKIGGATDILMAGWKVEEWQVVKNLSPDGDRMHQDVVLWQKEIDGVPVQARSLYSWRPYREVGNSDATQTS